MMLQSKTVNSMRSMYQGVGRPCRVVSLCYLQHGVAIMSIQGPFWRVILFLAPLCPICQNMTHEMRLLEKEFAGAPVEFLGVFPNPSTRPDQIAQFGETYGLNMGLVADTAGWAEQLDARWTPEAIVLDDRDSVVYRGRLNDRYFAPGKRRSRTRNRDLRNALKYVLDGKPVSTPVTDAVGCPIEGLRIHKSP